MFIRATSSPFAPAASIRKSAVDHNVQPDAQVSSHLFLYVDLLQTPCQRGATFRPTYKKNYVSSVDDFADSVGKSNFDALISCLPWWDNRNGCKSQGLFLTYDNLITRLWKAGIASPDGSRSVAVPSTEWTTRLGFQEEDPITDFRSGGLLALACLVYVLEYHPSICRRFAQKDGTKGDTDGDEGVGDASFLPLAGTSINLTNMLAEILGLDDTDALLSPKAFWKAFRNPTALLVLQGISLEVLADVVVDLRRERRREIDEILKGSKDDSFEDEEQKIPEHGGKVTAFDFSLILKRTKAQVTEELLGKGPASIQEMKDIASKMRKRYSD